MSAKRFNAGKPQLSYVLSARYALEGAAEVMEFGATKYDRDNWKKGLSVENLVDSLTRHLVKYLEGEERDDESNCHHLDHVLTNALFLSYHHNGRKPESQESFKWDLPPVPSPDSNPFPDPLFLKNALLERGEL